MRQGDQVFICCTVVDADAEHYTMAVSTIVYSHGGEVTECDVLIRSGQ